MKTQIGDKNPPKTDCLAAEVEGGFDEISKLPTRLERYAKARDRAIVNLAQINAHTAENPQTLFTVHLKKVASSMRLCGEYLGFRHYYTVGKVRLHAACFCKVQLLCPLCAIRRGSKTLESYTQRYEVIQKERPGLKMSLLTLTVKNGDDLSERFEHLKKAVSNALARRRNTIAKNRGYDSEFAKIHGLVGSYEVTNKGNGWHPHAHIMILHSERIDAAQLKREWQSLTKDSKVLRIDPARHPDDPAKDFIEIFKYSLKFSDLTPEQNLHAYEVLRGKRLLFCAGLFFGVEVPESNLDEPLEDLPYYELFYKYLSGSGYNLTDRQSLVA